MKFYAPSYLHGSLPHLIYVFIQIFYLLEGPCLTTLCLKEAFSFLILFFVFFLH